MTKKNGQLTPQEVVRASVRFQTPDRLPVSLASIGYSDTAQAVLWHESERSATGIGLDEWGCRWEKSEVVNMGQVRGHPIGDLLQVADYPFPEPRDPAMLERIEATIREAEKNQRYVILGQFMILFERMHSLCGMSETLEAIALASPEIAHLADRLVEYNVTKIRYVGERFGNRVQAYGGSDDWGTQLAPFISPTMWREFFLPRYRRICDAAKEFGWDVRVHSCGRINDLIPQMKEAGIDTLNMQQPRVYGIKELGDRFRGKMCFESLCDIQATLPKGDRASIEAEAREILNEWTVPEGGFVLVDYGDEAAIGAPHEAKTMMLRAFLEHDPFAARSGVRNPAWEAIAG